MVVDDGAGLRAAALCHPGSQLSRTTAIVNKSHAQLSCDQIRFVLLFWRVFYRMLFVVFLFSS